MSIRTKLREAAETELEELVEKLERESVRITNDSTVEPEELCRLLATKKGKTLRSRLVSKIANELEIKLLEQMNRSSDPNY